MGKFLHANFDITDNDILNAIDMADKAGGSSDDYSCVHHFLVIICKLRGEGPPSYDWLCAKLRHDAPW